MRSSRSPPVSRCTSPIPRARGSAARTRTRMACCANIFRRELICPVGTQTTSPRSPTPSTPDHAKPSTGAPLRKPSTNTYTRFTKPVLRPPTESAQYTSIAFAETLVLEGIAASIGSVGDAYDNALAETTIGLFKTEAVRRGSPFLTGPLRTIDDVESATMEWVDWFNNRRLHSQLNYIPPDEYEAAYYAQT